MDSILYSLSAVGVIIPVLEIILMILGIYALLYAIRVLRIYIRDHE